MATNNNGAFFGREDELNRLWNILRIVGWAAVPLILLLPAVAMMFTSEVQWTASDFILAGAVLIGAGLVLELVARLTRSPVVRFGSAFVVGGLVIAFWASAVA